MTEFVQYISRVVQGIGWRKSEVLVRRPKRNCLRKVTTGFVAAVLAFALAGCSAEPNAVQPTNTDSSNIDEDSNEERQVSPSENLPNEENTKPNLPTQNQFQQTLANLRFQYEPTVGADVYFAAAGGQPVEGASIALQLVFVDYEEYFLQLRVSKQPTGDFDIQSLEISTSNTSENFDFSASQIYEAYIYEELTYEIAEFPLNDDEEALFMSMLDSDKTSWTLTGSAEEVNAEFDKLSLLAVGTVLRFKQGLDQGYQIPDGIAQPLM